MTAPPKPWELARSATSVVPAVQSLATTPNQPIQSTSENSLLNSSYRRPTPYSMRSGMMGGYGMGLGGGGYGMGMGGGYGMGGYGGGYGMGGYGGGYGAYGNNSRGLMAIERFSMMVNSLCFTAETLEHSMNSMKMFWDTILRIKAWGAGGMLAIQKMFHDKIQYFIQYFLYLIGKAEKPKNKDRISLKSVILKLAICYLLWLAIIFCWKEITKPEEQAAEDFDSF